MSQSGSQSSGVPSLSQSSSQSSGVPSLSQSGSQSSGVPSLSQSGSQSSGVPDDCEDDCDNDGTPDDCEPDCDNDGTPDDCEPDCDDDGTPDDCEDDCDNDGTPDDCEPDCDDDGTPDDCEPDCDDDGLPDDCEDDCDGDGTPDDCEDDCDGDGTPDDCEPDCDNDGLPDDCEPDCDSDGTPDDCEPDCDNDGTPDDCEPDCDNDGTPDDCEPDCDSDGTPDDCEPDCDNDGLPDDCEDDVNGNGVPDDCEDCDDDGIPDDQEPDCDDDGLPDDCEDDCNANGIPDDCEGCDESRGLLWDLDDCWAFNDGSNLDYSEFTSTETGVCDGVGAWGTLLYRAQGGHSCTDDRNGNAGDAMCVGTTFGTNQFVADSPEAVRFRVTVDSMTGSARLENFSFYQAAPDIFEWSQAGYDSETGVNNPPSFYGIRIVRDGSEIFRQVDISTTTGWSLQEFDFSTDPAFLVEMTSAVFDFELFSYGFTTSNYDPDYGYVTAWDLDDLNVSVCCSDGTPSDCDMDGTPDFCEPDCDNDGTPDDCETDNDNNGIPDDCECVPAAWPTEPGSWDLSGSMWVQFSFGSDDYWIDCMTATYDGNHNLRIVGEATGSSGTLAIDMTYTVSEVGGDLISYDGSNDYGTITHLGTGETISLIGKSNGSYAGALLSTGAYTAELSGWFARASNGYLVGDWGGNDADATCVPCN